MVSTDNLLVFLAGAFSVYLPKRRNILLGSCARTDEKKNKIKYRERIRDGISGVKSVLLMLASYGRFGF